MAQRQDELLFQAYQQVLSRADRALAADSALIDALIHSPGPRRRASLLGTPGNAGEGERVEGSGAEMRSG